MKQEAKCRLEELIWTAAWCTEPHQALSRDEARQICQVVAAVPPHSKAPCTATRSGHVQHHTVQAQTAGPSILDSHRGGKTSPSQQSKIHLGHSLWAVDAPLPVLPACSLLPESPIREMLWKSASLKTELLWTYRAGPWKGASFS